jgi:hypothetical protein
MFCRTFVKNVLRLRFNILISMEKINEKKLALREE